MGGQIRSALLAGFIASTIWMFITVAVDASKQTVLVGGLCFLVGTAVITYVISSMVARRASPAPRRRAG